MTGITIWLLIAVSDGSDNRGNVSVVERFWERSQCEAVAKEIRQMSSVVVLRCVQSSAAK